MSCYKVVSNCYKVVDSCYKVDCTLMVSPLDASRREC